MKDLIERLEKAAAPDRELDNLIWFWLGQPLPDDCADCPARYTASLDAALTLVPEGHYWSFDSRGCAIVCADQPPSEIHGDCLGHKSPAIALCIAALKARAAKRDLTQEASNG